MSSKPCKFFIGDSKEPLDYNQMREYLFKNPDFVKISEPPVVEQTTIDVGGESAPDVSLKPAQGGEARLEKGDKIQWDVYGNEESGEWTVREKTKTRGGRDAVALTKVYVEATSDGKIYTKRSDKKKGRENDLNLVFIRKLFNNNCTYCDDSSSRKTLDRIDNSKGHTMDNVVLACERCNYIRRDMPYNAWLIVARSVKIVIELGLLNGWDGVVHKRKSLQKEEDELKKLKGLNPKPNKIKTYEHGTLKKYSIEKCRCEKCKFANTLSKREYRKKNKIHP